MNRNLTGNENELENMGAEKWWRCVQIRNPMPQFRHVRLDVLPSSKEERANRLAVLIADGMSEEEAKLRIQAEELGLKRRSFIKKLQAQLTDAVTEPNIMDTNELRRRRGQLVLEVYVKGDSSRRKELEQIREELQRSVNTEEDISLAMQLVDRYFIERLVDIDEQIDSLVE